MNLDFEAFFPRMFFVKFFPAACLLSLFYPSLDACGQGRDSLPDARPAIRAIYQPAPTPDQIELGPEKVKYYPLRLYWEWIRYTPRILSLLLPEATQDYEMAAIDCPSWEPERAVALVGNELHWAVAAEGNKTDYFISSAPLWKSWWASLLEKHLPDYFPEDAFPAWLHPSAALLNAWKDQKIRRLHWQEYSRNYVRRGIAVLPHALAQELKTTWKKCLETAVLDIPAEIFECCDQGYSFYSATPGLIATELHYYRGPLPLKRRMFHIFHLLVDATSMDNFTPETQLMLKGLCADARKIAGEMKKVPPRGFFWRELDTKFYSSCPDSANDLWEGKKPPLRQGKCLEAHLRKECMTLPLSANPVWKDLFPNAPEHVTAWMNIYSDGQCGGAYIHQGFLHTATTYLGRHSRLLYDFSRMDHPPAMTPYDLWWDGEEMRIRRSFLKLEPAAERELKTYLHLLSRFRGGNNHQGTFSGMLFSTDLGHKDLILQDLKEEFMEDEDSYPPVRSSVLDHVYSFWTSGDVNYLQEGSGQLNQLRKDRKELERYMEKHPPKQ